MEATNTGQPACNVALLDVSYIFKNYPAFKELMADLKADAEQAEEAVKKRRKKIEEMREQLKLLTDGSPDYLKFEKNVLSEGADLTVEVHTQRKAFLRRESDMYFEVYEQMSAEVSDYAKTNNICAVIRISDDPVNRSTPEGVLKYINRSVVWHDGRHDCTRLILERLIRKSKVLKPGKDRPAAEEAK